MNPLRPLRGLAALAGAAAPLLAAPPPTPVRPVTDTYHGVTVSDPYRWLEDGKDPAVRAWSDAQNAYARGILDALPHRAQIRARVTQILSAQTVAYGALDFEGGRLFALKRQPPKQQPFLVVMDSPERPEAARVLVDPNAMSASGGVEIDWFVPSHDGRLVAVSLSQGGSEAGDVHVFDVATGKEAYEVIPHAQNGTAGGSLAWEPDDKAFFYTRYPRGGERPPEDHEFYMQVYRHVLGTPTEADAYELGKDFPKIAEIQVKSTPEGVVLASFQKGDGGEFQHYVRTLDGKWTQLDTYADAVVLAEIGPSADGRSTPIYLVSRRDAPRGRLLRLTVDNARAGARLADAREVVPQGADTIVCDYEGDVGSVLATARRLYLTYETGGPSELRVFDLGGRPRPAPRQFAVGSVDSVVATGPASDDVLFLATSYIDCPAWFSYRGGATARLPISQESPVDFSDCEVVRESARSKDGTAVPVNIIRRKGLALDGSHPCIITGYGGYGINSSPYFSAARRAYIEQGVVFAEANIRGGGEFGEAWHRAGNLTRKQNVFDDFAAAAQHMIDAGYTSHARLALTGGSNGGLLMGAVLTQHPRLAKCVVSHVGIYDMLRVELSPNGAFNITEFGTVKDPEQFQALYAYSPYHHVVDGVKYPDVLFLTGANDPRVDPMQSRKMTARLQAAGANCLLRTSANSGHGIGSSLSERIEEQVDVDAYFFAELGVDYRPVN
ncbi:MAG TPA: prolyl oligopeptidase family serine peptidase [Opitutaceae bacterium]|nr:prolyl oligopeptidase family serine peptidase [Opitutaceae bacterium]